MTQKEIPKFHETFNPILEVLSDGKIIHSRELLKKVVDKFYSDIPQELLDQKIKSGETLILNRIAWGKSYLKKGGYIIYPERGMVQITEKGKVQQSKLTLKDVEGDSGFLEFYSDEKTKGVTNDTEIRNSSPQDLIDKGFSEIETQVKIELLEKLKTTDPYYFDLAQ